MEIITRLVTLTDNLIAWSEACEIGERVYVAVRSTGRGAHASWDVTVQYIDDSTGAVEGTEREGCWLTHDVLDRLERPSLRLLCSCSSCIEDAHEDAQDEEERRVARQARALALDLPERP